jgi:serine/threonine protein kinase
MPDDDALRTTRLDDATSPDHDHDPGPVTPPPPGSTGPAPDLGGEARPGDRIAGRYRVLGAIGAGGMGSVFRAEDEQLGRVVALKLLGHQRHGDPDAVARLRREARALARLSHPGIVQAFDAGEDRGRPFLVMEFVEGEDLRHVLKITGPIPPTQAASYANPAADAHPHAHDPGLVHRDHKPTNQIPTAGPRVKVLDLGLARFLQDHVGDPAQTVEGMGLGTPDYMAPEQFRDAHAADPRSDVYALGCTLYHLITGAVPFPGSSLSEKAHAHLVEDPRPVEELCPHVPAGLALVVGRMMAKRPGGRFPSMREVTEALAPSVAGDSESVPRLRETTSWDGGRLAAAGRRRRGRRLALGALAASLIHLAPAPIQRARRPDADPAPSTSSARDGAPAKPLPPWANTPDEPGVLTVAADGLAKHRTIREALDAARPGDTIRVVDDATYREAIVIDDPERLAGLTLDAPRGATFGVSQENPRPLVLLGVPGVTVRGFRFRSVGSPNKLMGFIGLRSFVTASGAVAGLTLRDLDFQSALDEPVRAILLEDVRIDPARPPATVEGCTIRVGYDGIEVVGSTPEARAGRVVIRDNRIQALRGVWLKGALEDVLVAGNVVADCAQAGLQVENWSPGGRGILFANNTIVNCPSTMRAWEDTPVPEYGRGAIELVNNLMRASAGYSIVRLREGEPLLGDDLLSQWHFHDNWRDRDAGLPLGPDDHELVPTGLNLLNPGRPDYLRPPAESPLTTQGAGRDDPSLPRYVGALPPEGTPPWDWTRTWKARTIPDRTRRADSSPSRTPDGDRPGP